jgi:hypothetical protein
MESAWDAFFFEGQRNLIDELKKEGWMPTFELCQKLKIKKSACLDKMKKDERFESRKFKVFHLGSTRNISFFRFKK